MKYYGDVTELQKIVTNLAEESIRPIVIDVLPHISVDEENNLVIENMDTGNAEMLDSATAYRLSTHYFVTAALLANLELETNQRTELYEFDALEIDDESAKSFADILIAEKKHHGMIEEPKPFHMKITIGSTAGGRQ